MKEFELNPKSWIVRYMCWMWEVDHTRWSNMCPFFWGTFATIVLTPFILLLRGTLWIADKCEQKKKPTLFKKIGESPKFNKYSVIVGKYALKALLVVAILGLIWAMIFVENIAKGIAILVATILMAIGLIAVIGFFINTVSFKFLGNQFDKLGSLISDLYHNNCPGITWKD